MPPCATVTRCLTLGSILALVSVQSVGCNAVQYKREQYERAFAEAGLRSTLLRLGADRVHVWTGGRGPAVVLVHGFGADAVWQWYGQVGMLAPKSTLIVPDLLWFGQSESSSRDFSPRHQVRMLLALLERLGVESADFVGISYGGIVVYELARLHPRIVRRMVLIDSPGRRYDRSDYQALCRRFATNDLGRVLIPEDESDVRRQLEFAFHDPPWMPDFAARQVLRDLVPHRAEKRALLEALLSERLESSTTSSTNPTAPALVIWGREDPIFPLVLGRRLSSELGAKLVVIDRARHAPNLEHPEEVNRAIRQFLRPSR